MDTIISLLLMAIFYLGPTLLKKYREKQIIPPEIPKSVSTESKIVPSQSEMPTVRMASHSKEQVETVVEGSKPIPKIDDAKSPWDGKVDPNVFANGIIFAEILQPPRAYRPFRPK